MDLNLQNKYALVCGSTQGIGKAAAIELAKLGATIILLARNEDALKSTLLELNTAFHQQHQYIVADFSDAENLKKNIDSFLQKNPAIHILINNTGGPAAGQVSTATTDEFIAAFNNHLICNHILAQAIIPGMKAEKYGRIINIISTSVKQPIQGLGVSNTIRAAVANWSKTLAGEVAQFGITVNNILPGATNTIRLQTIFENKAIKTGKTIDEIKHEMVDEIPAKRFAEPNEIANAIAFLASPAAAYINGINVPVDGGRTACL
jgi:3-oxoacyl-[acyl-carrier protein] reductase